MNSSTFLHRLQQPEPILLDGGLATELETQGHNIDGPLWSAEMLRSNPDAIIAAHRAYLEAGAEVLISASYQASRAGFHQLGVDAEGADALIASSVTLARLACEQYTSDRPNSIRHLVAASIGPYGAVLNDGSEYTGDYGVPIPVLRLFHEQRLKLLDGTGADVLACETIPNLDEAKVLAELLREVYTPAWVSFSCQSDTAISDGTSIEEAASVFADHPRVLAVGVNCTAPQHIIPLIGRIRATLPDMAVLAYPNSGEIYHADDNSWSGTEDAGDSAAAARQWIEAGASLVGGCCRMGPEHIRAMRAAI